MAFNGYFLPLLLQGMLALLLVTSFFTDAVAVSPILDVGSLKRSSFPPGFVFGAGSSAYQFEGAAREGGRGLSIWDTYAHKHPERIKDGSNGDVAVDQYHRYKEDVKMMKDMNMDSYRFSISWSRILPNGKRKGDGDINEKGVEYYNNLINELLANGMQPFVTLFHWDLPQALEDEYGGFLSSRIVQDFQDYADLCFDRFGDRVKLWVTLNEPWLYSNGGYAQGTTAPGRCTGPSCLGGNSGTEPYIVSHNQILAHAAAVTVYKIKYQASQKGEIGITLVSNWYIPLKENDTNHIRAARRSLDFQYGWFMEPLTKGDYPKEMRALVGRRLPTFSTEQAALVKGSFDFIGLNYYSSNYVFDVPPSNGLPSYLTDSLANSSFERNGIPLGLKAPGSVWIYFYPKGLRDLLLYTKIKYNNPVVYINENGMNEFNDPTLTLEESLLDTYRIDYYYRHFFYLRWAIEDGAKVKGYFAWSFLDCYEWFNGFTSRFGLNFVDYKDGLKRYPKVSAQWYANFLKRNSTV
ncbi:non-cyanogenic beta-glucosidase-like [Gastrolobium bilobum]|uniref:non-cyanogenic beta-glucosidase-like n=1 Tax=Gastrolobium bilobum TaxID=150636 RepID=UPI002AB2C6AE|nr:non-cyanogenic beta-glucosidase-like [Gastrolobium bilobum]